MPRLNSILKRRERRMNVKFLHLITGMKIIADVEEKDEGIVLIKRGLIVDFVPVSANRMGLVIIPASMKEPLLRNRELKKEFILYEEEDSEYEKMLMEISLQSSGLTVASQIPEESDNIIDLNKLKQN